MTETSPGGSGRRLWIHGAVMFSVLVAAYFFVYFQRMSVSIVGPDLVEEVGGTVGVLSSVYFWTYALMQIPCGVLTDRFGARAVCTAFLLTASAGCMLMFLGHAFWLMVLGKVMVAAGMAVVYVPLMKIVSVWFPSRDYAALNGVVISVGNVGAIAAAGPLSVLADAVGWRDVFLVLGSVTLVLAVLCCAVVRNSPGGARREPEGRADLAAGLREVARSGRRFWPCALAYFIIYGSTMTFQGTWAVTYFDNVYDFALSAAWMVTVLGVGKIICSLAVGAMASRGIIRSKKRAMLFGVSAFAAVWVAVFLLAGRVDSYWFWFAVCFLFGFFGGFMTLSYTQVKEWYPTSIAGTAMSAMNTFLFVGSGVLTAVSGWIIGTSYTLENFSAVWGVMAALVVVAVVLLAVSEERPAQDAVPDAPAGAASGASPDNR